MYWVGPSLRTEQEATGSSWPQEATRLLASLRTEQESTSLEAIASSHSQSRGCLGARAVGSAEEDRHSTRDHLWLRTRKTITPHSRYLMETHPLPRVARLKHQKTSHHSHDFSRVLVQEQLVKMIIACRSAGVQASAARSFPGCSTGLRIWTSAARGRTRLLVQSLEFLEATQASDWSLLGLELAKGGAD